MVILEDSVLRSLAKNAALVSVFPFLAAARSAGGCCGRVSGDLNNIKAQVAALPADGRVRFKQLSGFDSVRVVYRVGHTVDTVTF